MCSKFFQINLTSTVGFIIKIVLFELNDLTSIVISYKLGIFYCRLEQESGLYFNLNYFEEKIWKGEWDELEKYMSGFTNFNDNRFSLKIMFEISKQKYLEALDR